MKTEYDKMEGRSLNLRGPIPITQTEIIAAYKSQDRDARLLGEYWALVIRIRGLEHVLKSDKKHREGKTYSPEPLMIMQIKAMKKYANALAIRLDYEQGGRANPEVIARIKAMPILHMTYVGSGEAADPEATDGKPDAKYEYTIIHAFPGPGPALTEDAPKEGK